MLSGHAAYCFTTAKPKFPEDRGTPRVKYLWQPSLLVRVFTSKIHGENFFLNFLHDFQLEVSSNESQRVLGRECGDTRCMPDVSSSKLPDLRTTEAQFLQRHFTYLLNKEDTSWPKICRAIMLRRQHSWISEGHLRNQ